MNKAKSYYDPIFLSRCVDPEMIAGGHSNGTENNEGQSSVATSCGNVATSAVSAPSVAVPQQVFTMTEKSPTRAFS